MGKHIYPAQIGYDAPELVGCSSVGSDMAAYRALVGYDGSESWNDEVVGATFDSEIIGWDLFKDVVDTPAFRTGFHAVNSVASAFPPWGTLAAGLAEGTMAIADAVRSGGENHAPPAKQRAKAKKAGINAAKPMRDVLAELLLKAKGGDNQAQMTLLGIQLQRDPSIKKAHLLQKALKEGRVPLKEELWNREIAAKADRNWAAFAADALKLAKSKGLDRIQGPKPLPLQPLIAKARAAVHAQVIGGLKRAKKVPASSGVLVLGNGRLALGKFQRVG